VAAVAVVGLIAAACGSSTPSASKSSPSDTQAPAGTTATTGASSQVVADATANTKVGGTILVNASGMTLYKFSADSAGKSACTGACATAWPPVTVATGITPKGGSGATGTFGTITRSGGTLQVTYDSDPLYTFSGDSAAGDTNGQNLTSDGGTWTVVTAKMTPTTKAPTTTKPSGGGYGY
jgi:predicted lipoprotein with Yx(FWY)xxD motif